MAAYVKWLEQAGARVVPLILNEPLDVSMDKLSKLDAVFLPGGGGDYIDWGRPIYDRVKQYNDEGTFFPIWGTCLGFETLAIWESDLGLDVLSVLQAHAISLPIYYTREPSETQMFAGLKEDAEILTDTAMLLNSHTYGVDPTLFETDKKLKNMYKLTSVSFEPEGDYLPFTASMESDKYPFYGTQFHPEKVSFMFNDNSGVNHTWKSL